MASSLTLEQHLLTATNDLRPSTAELLRGLDTPLFAAATHHKNWHSGALGTWEERGNTGDGDGGEGNEESTPFNLPRYAMPNVSSLLPVYANSEQDIIFRTFHTGNYDMLRHLPNGLKHLQVAANRATRIEAAQKLLVPGIGQGPCARPANNQGLFQAFEYMPSRYSLADELDSEARLQSEAQRLAVGGREFIPAGTLCKLKHEDLTEAGRPYPYLAAPYELGHELTLQHRWLEEAKQLAGPFVPPGTAHLEDRRPTKHLAQEMRGKLKKWILQDWEGTSIEVYENNVGMWVIKWEIASVDSSEGMLAYMNVFVRCNELVLDFRLTKVVEFWNVTPGDGFAYFTVRPPWVRMDSSTSFFTLHPEEGNFQTSVVLAQQRQQAQQGQRDEVEEPESPSLMPRAFSSISAMASWSRGELHSSGA